MKEKYYFLKRFNDTLEMLFKANLDRYRRGKYRLSVVSAISLASIGIIAIALHLTWAGLDAYNFSIATVFVLTGWFAIILIHPDIRMYMRHRPKSKKEIDRFINQMLAISGVNMTFSSIVTIEDGIQDIFETSGARMRNKYHNKISGVKHNKHFNIYNMSANTGTIDAFEGSITTINIKTPDGYQLEVMPKKWSERRKNASALEPVNIQNIDEAFTVKTNEPAYTRKIIKPDIAEMFEMPHIDTGYTKREEIATIAVMRQMAKRLKRHRIEALIIKSGRLYMFTPFRNMRDGREYPFDISAHKTIEGDVVWSDIEDIIEKLDIVQKIKRNTKYRGEDQK